MILTIPEAIDYVKDHTEEILNIITTPAKTPVNGRKSYVCILEGCSHGKHGDGLAFNKNSKNKNNLKCFGGGCGFSGSIIDYVGEAFEIYGFIPQLQKCCDILGVTLETSQNNNNYQKQKKAQNDNSKGKDENMKKEQRSSLVSYFRECQKRLKNTDYHTSRGISEDTAKRFMLGYDPQFRTYNQETKKWETWQVLIIPTSRYTYIARNTDPKADKNKRYRKSKGKACFFNIKALTEATQPIFIVEGEIDALSIIEAGGEAIALGSGEKVDDFIRNHIKKQKPVQPLIIALDNDQAGKTATDKLTENLKKLDITFYVENLYNGAKDANETLVENKDYLFNAIYLITDQIKKIESEKLAQKKEEYQKQNSALAYIDDFKELNEDIDTPAQPTAFKILDEVTGGGLQEGLTIIGAVSSLGKTTLALQIADQIAQQERDVLIFSLEMGRYALMAKSISRQTFINTDNVNDAKTSKQITTKERRKNYSQSEMELIYRAIEAYKKYAKYIYIYEGVEDIGVNQIRETIEKHINLTGNKPVVFIDYLQIIEPYDMRASDKQNTDKAVKALKIISRDFKIPIIGISSFNRENYNNEVTMKAFKESGKIEYSSDALIGLQFEGAGESDYNEMKAKQANPRKVELVILKNRDDIVGDKILFEYYPAFNYFEEIEKKEID